MPEKRTIERARKAKRRGKSPGSQAGEFVREEMHHIRQGKHGARSAKQAIAIGLSKARQVGIPLSKPKRGTAASKRAATRTRATTKRPSRTRARETLRELRKEPRAAA